MAIIHILNTISGSISFVSSLIVIAMIFNSKTKLTLPYRRIIFALSIYEIILAMGNILTLPMIPASDNIWGSMGNDASCNALGFMMYVGSSGVIMYNLSLCVLYICIIVYSMKQRDFTAKIEPFLHVIPILLSFACGSILLVKQYYNLGSYSVSCWIASYPSNCGTDENVPCERGEHYKQMRMSFLFIPTAFTFSVIVITMCCVYHKVYKIEKSRQRYMFRIPTQSTQSTQAEIEHNSFQNTSRTDTFDVTRTLPHEFRSERNMSFIIGYRSRQRLLMKSSRNKAVLSQALLFVLSYFVRWAAMIALAIQYNINGDIPYWLLTITFTFYPLQGFMNLLMYVVPFIKTIRSSHPEYSWIYAFFRAVISGGDKET